MSAHSLVSLILSLQHHEQSLHGIERHLVDQIERAEQLNMIPDDQLRSFSAALEQILSIRTGFHERLAELCERLADPLTVPLQASAQARGREEERVETYAPFQTSPGLIKPPPNKINAQLSESLLGVDETPVLDEVNEEGGAPDLLAEAPTLEPSQSPYSLTQPSFKLQEALHKGTTSLDDRLPSPQPYSPAELVEEVSQLQSSSSQPSVLPPLMHTPLPAEFNVSSEEFVTEPLSPPPEPTPEPTDRSEALTLAEEPPTPKERPAHNDYITYVPPTPEPVTRSESGGHFEPISDLNFNLDQLDQLDQLERSLEGLDSADQSDAGLPSLSSASSLAQEVSNKRPPRVSLGVKVQVTSDVVRFEAMGHDISEGGIFIETDTPLEPGEQLKLRFELDRTAFVVEVSAQVRWCRLPKDAAPDRPVGGGLRFLNLSEQATAEIMAFTAERIGGGI